VMKIIYGICASIIIMVIGLILVCKRNVWIKRYHRRGSKFVVLKHYSIQPSVNRDDLHIPTYWLTYVLFKTRVGVFYQI
jgi:hypothetical protein